MQKNNTTDSVGPATSQWVLITKTFSKILLILLAFVPLLVDDGVIFPFISLKMIAIKIAITLVSLLILVNLLIAKSYRQEFYSKVKRMFRNPVFLTTAGFYILATGLSVIFSLDKYHAFWGNIERAEGFTGIAFYFAFFPLAYLIFNRKDWLWFFKATMFAGLILFVNEIATIPPGNSGARPGSFTGNPSFLAGFFLFVIMAAAIVAYDSRHDNKLLRLGWQIGSGIMILLSVIGIFETQTRGTILGLAAGLLVVAIYFAAKGKNIKLYNKVTLGNAAIILISLLVIFAAIFVVTKDNPFWQKVPGLSRFASISLTSTSIAADSSIQTRLISTEIGLRAMDPAKNGIIRTVFGWGQENFDVAYNAYYIPKYYEFEQEWFDRAHDKLVDVLVMEGVFGLIVYLAMWGSFLWTGFRKKFSVEKIALLFFGVAFFINVLSLFDQISTYIPLFAGLGYMAWVRDEEHQNSNGALPNNWWPYVVYVAMTAIFLFFLYVLTFSLIAYDQMRNYVSMLESGNLATIEQDIAGVLSPYTYAQEDIRGDFVQEITAQYQQYPQDASDLQPLMGEAIAAEEQVVNIDPWDPRQSLIIAAAYDAEGTASAEDSPTSTASLTYFKQGEQYYNLALQLAPERQDVLLPAAQNLFYQGDVTGALALLKQCYTEDPKVAIADYEYGYVLVFAGTENYAQAVPMLNYAVNYYNNQTPPWDTTDLITVYKSIASYFAQQEDAPDFIKTMTGLAILDSSNATAVNAAAAAAQAGQWYKININSL